MSTTEQTIAESCHDRSEQPIQDEEPDLPVNKKFSLTRKGVYQGRVEFVLAKDSYDIEVCIDTSLYDVVVEDGTILLRPNENANDENWD